MVPAAQDDRVHNRSLRDAVHDMLLSVAPEQREVLQEYWDRYNPQFKILADDGPDGPIVMSAGGYVNIHFNHRIMRLFWLGSFALWEGYVAFHQYAVSGAPDLARFSKILECFEATCSAENVDSVPWPDGIPEPGMLVDHQPENPARVVGELAIFAVSWALLHELRHLLHQQDGTSANPEEIDNSHREELNCDAFATELLLRRIHDYPVADDRESMAVLAKRQTGIYCALFTLTLLSRGYWDATDTHPAIQDRIDQALASMDMQGISKGAAIIAVAAFTTLKLAFPQAPNPEVVIGSVATRDGWVPTDELF